jgi:cytochrome c oxidase assembly factor CtaG
MEVIFAFSSHGGSPWRFICPSIFDSSGYSPTLTVFACISLFFCSYFSIMEDLEDLEDLEDVLDLILSSRSCL